LKADQFHIAFLNEVHYRDLQRSSPLVNASFITVQRGRAPA